MNVAPLEVVGHDDVAEQFQTALGRGRLAHAYLFVGPRGIGKRTFALKLAQCLLCELNEPAELSPCGSCSGCRLVLSQSHPDLTVIRRNVRDNDLSIELVRDAIHSLGLKPDRGSRKIAIVDDADLMNQYAANCFLKSLEEPPAGSLLILLGTRADRQLPTIRSRCQVVRFQPLADALVSELLVKTGAVEDRARAAELAKLAGGSLEQAQLHDEEIYQEFRVCFGEALRDRIQPAQMAKQVLAAIDGLKEAVEKRHRVKNMIAIATFQLHEALLHQTSGRSATNCSSDALTQILDRSLEASYHVDRMASLPLVVESWMEDMATLMSN